MSSKRGIRERSRARGCTQKIGHADELLAYKALVHGLRHFHLTLQHRVYKCRFCGKWHIGRGKE